MSLDTANLLARIVAFFHGGIRVLHTLRINNQESGCFMAPLLAALRNYLIFLMLPQGCWCHSCKDADATLARMLMPLSRGSVHLGVMDKFHAKNRCSPYAARLYARSKPLNTKNAFSAAPNRSRKTGIVTTGNSNRPLAKIFIPLH